MDKSLVRLQVKALELVEGSPLVRVRLHETEGGREVEIWVGLPEATAIQSHLDGIEAPRPMTHDLVKQLLDMLDVKVIRLVISEIKNDTYYALLTIARNGDVFEADCRPSDGIAIAVRFDAPIFISSTVFDEIDKLRGEKEGGGPNQGSILVDRDDTTIH